MNDAAKTIMYVIIGVIVLYLAGAMIVAGLSNGAGAFPIVVVGGIIIAAIVSSTSDSYKDQQEGIIRLNSQADYRKKVEMEHAILARHGYKMTAAYHTDMAKLREKYEYGPRRK